MEVEAGCDGWTGRQLDLCSMLIGDAARLERSEELKLH